MKLNIFGKIIKVLKEKNLSRRTGSRGEFYSRHNLIVIDDKLVNDEFNQTLLHELIHAVISRVSIDQTSLEEGVEEIICDAVATAIIENFKIKVRG